MPARTISVERLVEARLQYLNDPAATPEVLAVELGITKRNLIKRWSQEGISRQYPKKARQIEWTTTMLNRAHNMWRTRTLREVAAELGISTPALSDAMIRAGLQCPRPNPKGQRSRYGKLSAKEVHQRRAWFRRYRRLRLDGLSRGEAARNLQAHGCQLSGDQLHTGARRYFNKLQHRPEAA